MSESAAANVFNCVNYVGELFEIDPNKAKFLSILGGVQSGGKEVNSWQFPVAQPWNLDNPSQPDIDEDDAVSAPTATTYTRGQDLNACQIFQRSVQVTYAKQSDRGTISGASILGNNPVGNELDFQIAANLKQIAHDVNYTFINGTYNAATTTSDFWRCGGVVEAISTNTVAASAADMGKEVLNELVREMADNGAEFGRMLLLAGALDVQRISASYGYPPESKTEGGVAIQKILTDFCEIDVVFEPQVPSGTAVLVDASVVVPVFLPVPGKGHLFYEPLSKQGASERGQLYGQIGLAYGPEEFHGKITGLATS